jgi:hypothetical protein
MVAVAELGVGQGQAKEGVEKLFVGEQSISPILVAAPARHGGKFSRKRIDPAGSLRWLRHLPCGWCQIPRTFPSGPFTTVTRHLRGRQSPRFVARLRGVAHP